jgi:hypothetical protein
MRMKESKYANPIIFHVGRLFYLIEVKLKITIFKNGKKRDRKRKKAKRK